MSKSKQQEKTYGKWELADIGQAMMAEDLEAAVTGAGEFFNHEKLTSEMVFGYCDRVLCFEDDADQALAKQNLAKARAIAGKLLGSPKPEDIFGVYDRIFAEIDDDFDDEDSE